MQNHVTHVIAKDNNLYAVTSNGETFMLTLDYPYNGWQALPSIQLSQLDETM